MGLPLLSGCCNLLNAIIGSSLLSIMSCPVFCWQDGGLAEAPTAQEFSDDVMNPTTQVTETKLQDLQAKGEFPSAFINGVQPKYSFDNAPIHTAAINHGMLAEWDFDMAQRLALPPYSPDMHRVIEHTHGTATVAFRRWLYDNPSMHTSDQYKAAFKQIYHRVNTQQSVYKDVKTLHTLYDWVWENDGDMSPTSMR